MSLPSSPRKWLHFLIWLLLFSPGILATPRPQDQLSIVLFAMLVYPLVAGSARWLQGLAALVVVVFGVAQVGYYLTVGEPLDTYFWATMRATTAAESADFVRTLSGGKLASILAWGFALLAGPAALMKLSPDAWRPRRSRAFSAGVFVVIGAYCLFKPSPAIAFFGMLGKVYPISAVESWYKKDALSDALMTTPPTIPPQATPPLADVVVMVIGESSSRARWQLFGYAQPTNPELSRLPGLYTFGQVISVGNNTAQTVPALITGRQLDTLKPSDPSVFDLAKAAGYATSVISNQGRVFDAFGVVMRRADHFVQFGGRLYDDALTPHFEAALAKGGRQLVILHMYGSHPDVAKRTPDPYRTLPDPYDNSIVYTDHLLARWIGLLAKAYPGKATALLYISDHGVMLGECGVRYTHGTSRNAYEVPMLMWASPELLARDASLARSMQANASARLQSFAYFSTAAHLLGYAPQHYPSVLSGIGAAPARLIHGKDYDGLEENARCELVPRRDTSGTGSLPR